MFNYKCLQDIAKLTNGDLLKEASQGMASVVDELTTIVLRSYTCRCSKYL